MRYLFIKKGNNGFDFCSTTNDYYNSNFRKLDEYQPCEAEIQVIANGRFFVFYDKMYVLEMSYLKMLLDDTLAEKDSISAQYIRNTLIPKIKDMLSDCKRLFVKEVDGFKDEACSGTTIITDGTKLYTIRADFSCVVQEEYLNDNDVTILTINDILGRKSPLELMEYLMKKRADHNGYLNFPLIYGNTSNNKITIRHINGETKSLNLEDFICPW